MSEQLKRFVKSDPVRRGARSFLDAFLVTFGILVIPWVADIYNQLATAPGGELDVDLAVGGKLLLASGLAGAIGVWNAVKNWREDASGKSFIIPK